MRSQVQQNRSIELFCGTGGLALGLQKAGFHHTALYEWDKDSCDNIRANIQAGYKGIESWNVHQADVRAVCYDGLSGKSIWYLVAHPASRSLWEERLKPIMTSVICFLKLFGLSEKSCPKSLSLKMSRDC